MSGLVLAVHGLVAAAVFLALVWTSTLVGRRLQNDHFSWLRYGAFLVVAAALAAFSLWTPEPWAQGAALALLVVLVSCRGAADAQSKTLAEKAGFLQLYAGFYFAVESLLRRGGALVGTQASPPLAFQIHDALGHLVLPLPLLASGSAALPPWAEPGHVVGVVGAALSSRVVLVLALTTFALAAFAYAHFAEHATLNVGLSLLPAPTMVTVAFAAAWLVEQVTGGFRHAVAENIRLFLAPYFIAEGLWVFHRMLGALRTRGAWTALMAAGAVVLPGFASALAVTGIVFHLVRLRAFQPVLGDLERSAIRPRLGKAFVAATAAAMAFVLLALLDRAALAHWSPSLEAAPAVCGQTTITETSDGVSVTGGATHFVIDRDETPLYGAAARNDPASVCAARGARLCTSDEWTLACLCTYANESASGPKITTNERLAYRVESDRKLGTSDGKALQHLLTGASEVVSPAPNGGGVLVAGSSDAVPDPWTADCRYRGLLTRESLSQNAWPFVAVRCCR
jgi:hypothetical protein